MTDDRKAAPKAEPTPKAPAAPKAAPDPAAARHDAQMAELARQEEVRRAVLKAGTDELPRLGGPIREPGLGR
jgi:hypothetical protein